MDLSHLPPVMQRAFRSPGMHPSTVESLLENAPDDLAQVRLLAASAKESSAWLYTIPISSLSLRMDDNTFRVAVGLRLGSTFCRPHACQHCGVKWTISPLMGSVIEKVRGATIAMQPPTRFYTGTGISVHSIQPGTFWSGLLRWQTARRSNHDPVEEWQAL